MASVDGATRNSIRELIAAIGRTRTELREVEEALTRATTFCNSNLNFRERHLRGWFGGDWVKSWHYRQVKKSLPQLTASIARLTEALQVNTSELNDTLDEYLAQQANYAELLHVCDNGIAARDSATFLLRRIQHALKKVSTTPRISPLVIAGADAMLTYEYLDTQDVGQLVAQIRVYVPDYHEALGSFVRSYGTECHPAHVREMDAGLDLLDIGVDAPFDEILATSPTTSPLQYEAALQKLHTKIEGDMVKIKAALDPLLARRQQARDDLVASIS